MAARLRVTRGSFYWHFRDLADFQAQVLRSWAESTTIQVAEALEAQEAGPERLEHLMRRVFGARRSLDRAIRAWAASDADVAAAVALVDARRVAYLTELLRAAGVADAKAAGRAAFLYWALLGQAFVMDPAQADPAAGDLGDFTDLLLG